MYHKKILIAIDNNTYSLRAAKTGFEVAHNMKAEIALVFVINQMMEEVTIDTGTTQNEIRVLLLKEAEETIDQLSKTYNGVKKISRFTPEGNPKEAILNVAREWEADLIVMGIHRQNALAQLINGSTAVQVMNHSTIPSLIVPFHPEQ